MTISQKRKIIKRIQDLEHDIATLEQVRTRLASSGYASATLSSSGGSQSYTRMDIGKISETIASMRQDIKGCRRLLAGSSQAMPSQIYTVYC